MYNFYIINYIKQFKDVINQFSKINYKEGINYANADNRLMG